MSYALFLTDCPADGKVTRIGEQEELHVYCDGTMSLIPNIQYFDALGNSLSTSTYTAIEVTGNKAIFIFTPSTLEGIPTETIHHFDVWLGNFEGFRNTEKRRYYLDHVQHQNTLRVGWVNLRGGVDRFTFFGNKKQTIEADKSRMTKAFDYLAGEALNNDKRGVTVLQSSGQKSVEIYSGYLSEAMSEWLAGLFLASHVWVYSTKGFEPIDVTGKKVLYSDDRKLNQIKLEFEYANKIVSQDGC